MKPTRVIIHTVVNASPRCFGGQRSTINACRAIEDMATPAPKSTSRTMLASSRKPYSPPAAICRAISGSIGTGRQHSAIPRRI